MTRDEQRLEKAIKVLKENFKAAQAAPYVMKPLSYALYRTWRYFNDIELSRFDEDSENGTGTST